MKRAIENAQLRKNFDPSLYPLLYAIKRPDTPRIKEKIVIPILDDIKICLLRLPVENLIKVRENPVPDDKTWKNCFIIVMYDSRTVI
jgi:hypothetical protein